MKRILLAEQERFVKTRWTKGAERRVQDAEAGVKYDSPREFECVRDATLAHMRI